MSTTDPHNIPYVAQLVEPEGVRETDAPRKKPKFVYFLAVANLLYAGAGAVFLGDIAVNSILAWWKGQTLAFEFFTLVSTVSGLFGAVLLVIGSIGLFRFHPIGRGASLWYVRISLSTTAVLFACVILVDLRRENADLFGLVIFGGAFFFIRLFYPLILLASLRHKSIANAFASRVVAR